VRAAVGDLDALKRNIRRVKEGNTPVNLKSIPNPLHVPDEYTTTSPSEDREFLIYDNESETNRILVTLDY
jgi:hypothetical protein